MCQSHFHLSIFLQLRILFLRERFSIAKCIFSDADHQRDLADDKIESEHFRQYLSAMFPCRRLNVDDALGHHAEHDFKDSPLFLDHRHTLSSIELLHHVSIHDDNIRPVHWISDRDVSLGVLPLVIVVGIFVVSGWLGEGVVKWNSEWLVWQFNDVEVGFLELFDIVSYLSFGLQDPAVD